MFLSVFLAVLVLGTAGMVVAIERVDRPRRALARELGTLI
jgi:hypothetical protein